MDDPSAALALVYGPEQQLLNTTLVSLLKERAENARSRTALVVPWQNYRATYSDLEERSNAIARALLALQVKHGDHVGILAGNRREYVELFLGSASIGGPFVVHNSTWTPTELRSAVIHSACKVLFVAATIGPRDMSGHLRVVQDLLKDSTSDLREVITLGDNGMHLPTYDTFLRRAHSPSVSAATLQQAMAAVKPSHVLNLQFTSGTTGQPKSAELTHRNLLNNADLLGQILCLTPDDVMICGPPLFHSFGLVAGVMNALVHSCPIVLAADVFDPQELVDAMVKEKVTVLLGTPTMFLAELDVMKRKGVKPNTIRTGVAAGAPVPEPLMKRIRTELGVEAMLIAYGMTETSPMTFVNRLDDSLERRLTTVGKVCPNTGGKIVDGNGKILNRGQRGEVCTSGYALMRGYYKNPAKTQEVMEHDENGVRWMHTGDEGYIDRQGYLHITGRIKDIIIRGGENIYPAEIEERLIGHQAILEASVVGIKNEYYGEVVGAFLRSGQDRSDRPGEDEVRDWVRGSLDRRKAPQHIFWVGDPGIGADFPKTGSGKIQKHILSDIGSRLVGRQVAKL